MYGCTIPKQGYFQNGTLCTNHRISAMVQPHVHFCMVIISMNPSHLP